jgi:uncharacterized protein (TIGR02001 family)
MGFAATGSVTVASQYIFRGLTQTDGRPAIQGGLDLSHRSGLYLSLAMSNISWYTDQNAGLASNPTSLGSPGRVGPPLYSPNGVNSAGVELDVFGGYKAGFAKDWTIDLGLYRYLYPGNFDNQGAYRNPATTEAYLGVSYAWASLKYSRVISANTFGVNNSGGAGYLDASVNIPVSASGWSIQAHAGRTTYLAKSNPGNFQNGPVLTGDNGYFSYSDFKLGITREFKNCTVSLAGTHAGTRARAADNEVTVYENAMGRNIGGNRLTLSLTKNF